MPISEKTNPGKYDDICTVARNKAKANGAVLIIIDGNKGSGFSVQLPLSHLLSLPAMLETMAKEIRLDLQSKMKKPG